MRIRSTTSRPPRSGAGTYPSGPLRLLGAALRDLAAACRDIRGISRTG